MKRKRKNSCHFAAQCEFFCTPQTNNVTQKSLAKIAQITLMMLRDLILLAKMLARMEENFCTIESHKTVPFICRSNLLRLHYNVPYYCSKIRKKKCNFGKLWKNFLKFFFKGHLNRVQSSYSLHYFSKIRAMYKALVMRWPPVVWWNQVSGPWQIIWIESEHKFLARFLK